VTDTLQISRELTADNLFTREQAERLASTMARTVEDQAATKGDLVALQAELAAVEVRLAHKFDQLKWVNVTALALLGSAAIKYLFHL
jgi:hypothetical protein